MCGFRGILNQKWVNTNYSEGLRLGDAILFLFKINHKRVSYENVLHILCLANFKQTVFQKKEMHVQVSLR